MTRPIFDHGSVSVADLEAAIYFYESQLGLQQIDRPDFGFPGAWFQVGDLALHLTTGGSVDRLQRPAPNEPHLAFAIATEHELERLLQELRASDVPIRELENSPAARRQVFILDPSGNEVELIVNF